MATYTDNGTNTPNGSHKVFTYTFPVLQTEDIKVALNGLVQATTKYTSSLSPAQIEFNNTNIDSSVQESTGAPKTGVVVRVFRETTVGKTSGDDDPKAVFAAGSSIRAADLNANTEQALYAIAELRDQPKLSTQINSGAVTSAKIEDGTIVNADVNASAAIAGTKISPDFGSQNIATTGTVDGRDVSVDGTKLDTIETNAKDDQTAAEIRTLVESASDSNVFTDADHTKLNGIETGATADQTNAEIRTAVENATDSNVFTDADHTKLNSIATGAEVNVNADWNSSSGDSQILNKPTVPANINDLSDVNTAGVANGKILKYDSSTSKFIIADDTGGGGGGGSSTFVGLSDTPVAFSGSGSKTVKVNSAANALEFVTVNELVDGDKGDITVSSSGATWTVDANAITTSKIIDDAVTTDKLANSINTEIAANTAKTTNATHTGEVTGATALTIADDVVDEANLKVSNSPTNGYYLQAQSGNTGGLTWASIDSDSITEGNSKAEVIGSGTNDGEFKVTLQDATNSGGGATSLRQYTSGSTNVFELNPSGGNTSTNSKLVLNHITGTNAWSEIYFTKSGSSSGNSIIRSDGGGSGGYFDFYPEDGNVRFRITGSSTVTQGNVLAWTDSTYDIGTNTARWRNVYADDYYGSAANLTNIPAANITGTLPAIDGSNLTGLQAGATGGGSDEIFWENGQTVTTNYTITNNKNAMSAGPITINNGIAVTIGTGENWTIV